MSETMMTYRQLRRIGGDVSRERQLRSPSWLVFKDSDAPILEGGWKDQCRCGLTCAKAHRGSFWCPGCGREKPNFPKGGVPLYLVRQRRLLWMKGLFNKIIANAPASREADGEVGK